MEKEQVKEEQVKELTKIVGKNIEFEKDGFDSTVDIITNFSKENSISPDLLLEISSYYISNQKYNLAYIFAKTSSNLSIGNMKATAHYNAGVASNLMIHKEEAEIQYRLALEANPEHVATHCDYGNLLRQTGRKEEAEKHYKIAIELDPNEPSSHVAYGVFLLLKNLESKAIEEMKIASKLFGEKGNKINEHILLAWFYEILSNKHYILESYQKSGKYAEISGNEYIEASKNAEEKFKGTFLIKGYTFKGKAKIRKLEIKTPFYKDILKKFGERDSYKTEKFIKIMDCIMDASKCYEKAAEASLQNGLICNACSISMSLLSEMLDYMLAITKQRETPQLEDKLEYWNEKLAIAKSAYKEHSKGELFIESLYKLMECIQNLDKYKKHGTREYERAFEKCCKELNKIVNNIEGPLQKIIEDSAKQMDLCRFKIIRYAGTETGELRTKPSKLSRSLKWIYDHPIKFLVGVVVSIVVAVISGVIQNTFFP